MGVDDLVTLAVTLLSNYQFWLGCTQDISALETHFFSFKNEHLLTYENNIDLILLWQICSY